MDCRLSKGTGSNPHKTNLPKMRRLRNLMQHGGERIGIPTPVSITYHPNNWSEGVTVWVNSILVMARVRK